MPVRRIPRATTRTARFDPVFLHKLEQLELVSRKIFVGRMKGERKSQRRGSSVEFAEHRNYTVGDDLRHIDWNVYGRLDKLFLKLFLEEEDLHVYTVLDTSLSMDFGTPTKLRYGKQVAAALAFIGLVNHDRVLVDTFSARLEQGLHGIRGRSQMWRVVQYLDHLEATGSSDLTAACREFAIRHAGKGVVVVISDFLDKRGYQEALRYLLARNMDIYVVHVLSHEEVDPELVGDLRLVDCRGRRHRRDHHQRPAAQALQGQPERLRRRPQGMVHQPRHHLYLHDQPESVRQADPQLLARAGAGEMSREWTVVSGQ